MAFTDKLIQFVTHHWVMVGAFLLVLILLFVDEARSKGVGKQISVHEAVDAINREDALVIDNRGTESFKEGHIAKARNIPSDQIDQSVNKLTAFKQRPIIVVCEKGQNSMSVANKLRKHGFENVRSLSGGMQAWKSASMPVKKGSKNGKD